MDYSSHYDRIMARARGRVLTGYKERHHVVPRCMGGGNEPGNLVELTAEEHYVAHQLLVKMHPGVHGLATAAVYMAKQCTGNKAYGWLRRRHAAAVKISSTGRVNSPEARAKISAKRRLWSITPETARKISAANKGRRFSPEHRAKLSAAHKGRPRSAEHCANISKAKRGKTSYTPSVETRAKIAAANRGKPLAAERKAKISAANRGKKRTDEQKAKRASMPLVRLENGQFSPGPRERWTT